MIWIFACESVITKINFFHFNTIILWTPRASACLLPILFFFLFLPHALVYHIRFHWWWRVQRPPFPSSVSIIVLILMVVLFLSFQSLTVCMPIHNHDISISSYPNAPKWHCSFFPRSASWLYNWANGSEPTQSLCRSGPLHTLLSEQLCALPACKTFR